MKNTRILIIADIEGSSGCRDRDCARFLGRGWPRACREMTRDVNAVVTALFKAGISGVHVRDFHRTGYNILSKDLHPGAELVQGYHRGPIPGMGNVGEFHGLVMLGMHAPSGAPGFLSHTLTSRIARLTVNRCLISEAQLFSAALAPIPPLFFQGGRSACDHTREFMPGTTCFALDRNTPDFSPVHWRRQLASACVKAATRVQTPPYEPKGPFRARLTMVSRDEARAIGHRWGDLLQGSEILLNVPDFATLFREVSRRVYLSPFKEKLLPMSLPLYHLAGRAGLAWAQKKAPVFRKPENRGRE